MEFIVDPGVFKHTIKVLKLQIVVFLKNDFRLIVVFLQVSYFFNSLQHLLACAILIDLLHILVKVTVYALLEVSLSLGGGEGIDEP